MTDEILGHLEAAEKSKDLHDMRLHLAILERSQLYFGEEEWKRDLKVSEQFRNRIMQAFGSTMGS